MVVIDTSAWIEFLNDTGHPVVDDIEHALDNELVCLGDLIFCEVLQGIRDTRERKKVKSLFGTMHREAMGGLAICEKASDNYRHLRSLGLPVRKTIDMIIGTLSLGRRFIKAATSGPPTPICTTGLSPVRIPGQVLATTLGS